jgi:hypothetical protein
MELLCSLLTGFSLWLLVFHWRRRAIGRVRQLAGELVCMAASTRSRRLRWGFFIYFLVILGCGIIGVLTGRPFDLGDQFRFAFFFAVVLMLGIPAARNTALEVRERGVMCWKLDNRVAMGGLYFVPWNQVATCQWVRKGFGAVSRFDDARNCLTIALDGIRPEQKAAVTAAVGQFVVVYDHDGTRLAEPDKEHLNAKWISWRSLDPPRFQFDLQTMLLVVVVVACAAGLCSIRYRNPHYQALLRVEAFSPRIDYSHNFKMRDSGEDDVSGLDFSACERKPSDDDLASLEPLVELRRLDLTGCPITDSGLVHLKKLRELESLDLAGTGVTTEGIIDLGQSLPHVGIHRSYLAPAPPTNAKQRP